MKHRLLAIVLLILAGVVVNVAVAWGCVLAFTSPEVDRLDDPTGIVLAYYDTDLLGPVRWCGGQQYSDTGWTRVECMCGLDGENWATVYTLVAGWPFRSMFGREQGLNRSDRPYRGGHDYCLLLPESMSRQTDIAMPVDFVPLLPIWPEFAANTLLYAALLWLLFIVPPVTFRRFARNRSGLCPKCAYPLGQARVCTECGHPLRVRPAAQSSE